MYLNDPTLYGATLPYKDIPMQTPFVGPFTPWQQQKFLPQMHQQFFPPFFGYTPQFFNYPQIPQTFNYPQIPQTFNHPQIPQTFNHPQMPQTFNYPQMPQTFNHPQMQPPWMTNFNLPAYNNLPYFNWQRPLPY